MGLFALLLIDRGDNFNGRHVAAPEIRILWFMTDVSGSGLGK